MPSNSMLNRISASVHNVVDKRPAFGATVSQLKDDNFSLTKKRYDFSSLLRKQQGLTKSWKKSYYFVLHGSALLQYKARASELNAISGAPKKELAKVYDLRDAITKEERYVDGLFPFTIRLQYSNEQASPSAKIALAATSPEIRAQWLNRLERAKASIHRSNFSIGNDLGKGKWGRVCTASLLRSGDPSSRFSSDHVVALKEVELSSGLNLDHVSNERHVLQIVSDSVDLQSNSLSADPFVVKMIASWQEANHVYYALEYMQGGDLFGILSNVEGKLPLQTVQFYAAEVLLGLEHLHSLNIVYRDLKPENILVDSTGHIKLGDLGLAKHLLPSSTTSVPTTRTFCGTDHYLPPEMLSRSSYTFAVDYWQFGCFVYELVVGVSPFHTSSKQHQDRMKSRALIQACQYKIPRWVDDEVKEVVNALLKSDPTQRLGCDILYKNLVCEAEPVMGKAHSFASTGVPHPFALDTFSSARSVRTTASAAASTRMRLVHRVVEGSSSSLSAASLAESARGTGNGGCTGTGTTHGGNATTVVGQSLRQDLGGGEDNGSSLGPGGPICRDFSSGWGAVKAQSLFVGLEWAAVERRELAVPQMPGQPRTSGDQDAVMDISNGSGNVALNALSVPAGGGKWGTSAVPSSKWCGPILGFDYYNAAISN